MKTKTATKKTKPASVAATVIAVPQLEPRTAYLGVKHMLPEAIRNIRAGLDVGSTVIELVEILEKHAINENFKSACRPAVQYMADNPSAGVVRWDGCRYDFVEDIESRESR